MKYFVAPGEDRSLDAQTRRSLRGSYRRLSDGVTHYELTGPEDGAIVVLAGGLTVSLFYWDATAAALHGFGLRTLAYSAYGRGYSDRVRGPYDDALFVRQLTELMDALRLPAPRHLVGASMGALVATAYLRDHAAATSSLTLVGPAGLSPRPAVQKVVFGSDLIAGFVARHLGHTIFDKHQNHNAADPERAAELAAMIDDAYRYEGSLFAFFDTLQHFRLFDRADTYRHAATLGVPTTLIWGTDDRVTPVDGLDEVRTLLHPQRVEVIAECGHMVPFERPAIVADHIMRFTATCTDRPGRP